MESVNLIAAQLVLASMPWVALLLSIMFTMWLKEFATSLFKSWSFYKNPAFYPGDKVYLDGDCAVIIHIGMGQTIFEIERDGRSVWRYIPTHKVETVKLEKIVDV